MNYIQVFGIYSQGYGESLKFLRNTHLKRNALASMWQKIRRWWGENIKAKDQLGKACSNHVDSTYSASFMVSVADTVM